ncbi:hypothetical protein [Microbulbifer discodermiae]|uniref:hypothetical protein n=1 Tax=Microbulbifer sp. 2201CG32-9 TaxID=3232309 RepID=UPI00345B7C4D
MDIAIEAELLRYQLLMGMVDSKSVSKWAQNKIAGNEEFPDLVYDLSLSVEKGESETSRLLGLLAGNSECKEVIFILFKEFLAIASKSFDGARKVASYLFSLGALYTEINNVNITFFNDAFQEAELGFFNKEETQKKLVDYLASCVEGGIKSVDAGGIN